MSHDLNVYNNTDNILYGFALPVSDPDNYPYVIKPGARGSFQVGSFQGGQVFKSLYITPDPLCKFLCQAFSLKGTQYKDNYYPILVHTDYMCPDEFYLWDYVWNYGEFYINALAPICFLPTDTDLDSIYLKNATTNDVYLHLISVDTKFEVWYPPIPSSQISCKQIYSTPDNPIPTGPILTIWNDTKTILYAFDRNVPAGSPVKRTIIRSGLPYSFDYSNINLAITPDPNFTFLCQSFLLQLGLSNGKTLDSLLYYRNDCENDFCSWKYSWDNTRGPNFVTLVIGALAPVCDLPTDTNLDDIYNTSWTSIYLQLTPPSSSSSSQKRRSIKSTLNNSNTNTGKNSSFWLYAILLGIILFILFVILLRTRR